MGERVGVRAWTAAEQARVDDALRSLTPRLPGARLELLGGVNRPPLEAGAVGASAHACGERASVSAMSDRAVLVARLLQVLSADDTKD